MSMVKFISEVCRECQGQCCFNFPVWVKRRSGKLHRNRVSGTGTNKLRIKATPKTWQNITIGMNNNFTNFNHPCYYWFMGGCPSDKEAKGCKQWICPMIECLIYPREFDSDGGGNPTQAAIEVYKAMRRM